jgi:hypothetical protein
MAVFKRVRIQATISIACEDEQVDYEDSRILRGLVFHSVRDDGEHIARIMDIVGVSTTIDENLDDGDTLSYWMAKELVASDRSWLQLSRVRVISDKAADALSKFQGDDLSLDGLLTLSDPAARDLAKCRGALSLNGLTAISDDAAVALAGHTGDSLSLNGLTRLSDASATALAAYKGILSLDSLALLTNPALAKKLVAAAIASQVEHQMQMREDEEGGIYPWPHFGEVSLPSVTELSPLAARAIVEEIHAVSGEYPDLYVDAESIDGPLRLDGLRSLSVETARELSRHRGYLSLRGLEVLSAAAAESLATRGEYTLDLSGLNELPDDVVTAFTNYRGRFQLGDSCRLSPYAKEKLTAWSSLPGTYSMKR